MSHASTTATTTSYRIRFTQAGLLIGLLVALYGVTRSMPTSHDGIGIIASLGLLLVIGSLMSELASVIGIPHLTGYLVAGIIAGPHVMKLVEHSSVEQLSKVNALALALIALAGGAELKMSALKQVLKSLGWATLVQSTLVVVIMTGVFFAIRPLIPFAMHLAVLPVLGVALLWGVLSVSRSPSATLGILSQTRARGPVSTYTLTYVMTSDVVVVILLAAVMTIARPLITPGTEFSGRAFQELGHEILGSVSLGTLLGLVLTVYLKLVGRQLIVVFVALGFVLTDIIGYLRFDSLLTFLVAGFVVQNLSSQGEKFLTAIERMGGVVYVVFFATAGAHLNIPLLRALWPVALILCASRGLASWLSVRIASHIAKDPPSIHKWGWSGLISQAGLTLGLSTLIEREFPLFGSGFRALAVATVAVNEMIGPILFKSALDRSGETSSQPRHSFTSDDETEEGIGAPTG